MESIDFITGSRQPTDDDDDFAVESDRYRKRARVINSNSNSNSNDVDPVVLIEPVLPVDTIVTRAEDHVDNDGFMHNVTTISEYDRSLRMLANSLFISKTERHNIVEIDEIDGVAVNVSLFSKSTICKSLRIVISFRVKLISGTNILDPIILFRRSFTISDWSPKQIHVALQQVHNSLSHLHFDRKLGEFVDASFSGAHDSAFHESCADMYSRGNVWAALASSNNILRRVSNIIICVVCYKETGTVVTCGGSHVVCYPCLTRMAVSRGIDFMRQTCDRFVCCPCCRTRIADSITTNDFFSAHYRSINDVIADEIVDESDDDTFYEDDNN